MTPEEQEREAQNLAKIVLDQERSMRVAIALLEDGGTAPAPVKMGNAKHVLELGLRLTREPDPQ